MDGVILNVQVQTRSSNSSVSGRIGDYLKIRLKSPPVDNKANSELIAFLGKTLKVPKGDIEIFRGKSGRKKRVFIRGLSAEEVSGKLLP
jgi:uncharacterized protein (TIGR00251 family)